MTRLRILIISDEVWNDQINGNNVLSNWFEDFEAEFANLYLNPGKPLNRVCQRYFQITDTMMLNSILGKERAGVDFTIDSENIPNHLDTYVFEDINSTLYKNLKKFSGEYLRVMRELLWNLGRVDVDRLRDFISSFKPDLIFSIRMATNKILRIESIVYSIANCPMIAFTGDDEYSYKQFILSPLFWINRFFVRQNLRKNASKYSLYYTISDEQMQYYKTKFNCEIKTLHKCGTLKEYYSNKRLNNPIVIVYAGKLYSKRWKSLIDLAECISIINRDKTRLVLKIYTKDEINGNAKVLLNDRVNSFIEGPVSQNELLNIYRDSDIALHVESLSLKYRLLTKYSFSTKIVDILFSGCAMLVYSWDKHSGFLYLEREDAAITASSKKQLLDRLNNLIKNPELINIYAKKAWDCSERNHIKRNVQLMLMNDFEEVLCSYSKAKESH